MFHENFRDHSESKVASPGAFGLTFAAVFLMIGALPLFRHEHVRMWSLVVGLVFLAIALLLPRLLRPLSRAWLLVGSLIHGVTTPVLMALVFVFVITPVALLRKAVGSSGLALRFDSKLDSYWIPRDLGRADAESLKRQF
jgi:multisubunit Na+/H+ antiporter MnhG subunit